jgi:hypothetical protein
MIAGEPRRYSFLEEIVIYRAIMRAKRIALFGASSLARVAISRMKNRFWTNIAFIVDNNEKLHGTVIDGLSVKSPESLVGEADYVIVASDPGWPSISAQLQMIGMKEKRNFADFRGMIHEGLAATAIVRINISRWRSMAFKALRAARRVAIIGDGPETPLIMETLASYGIDIAIHSGMRHFMRDQGISHFPIESFARESVDYVVIAVDSGQNMVIDLLRKQGYSDHIHFADYKLIMASPFF